MPPKRRGHGRATFVVERGRRNDGPVKQTGKATAPLLGTTYRSTYDMQQHFARQTGYLTADDAAYMGTLRDAPYREVLAELIRHVERNIREAAYAPGATPQKEVMVEVPIFLVDFAPYDMENVLPDLVRHFQTLQYHSEWTQPNILFISWAHITTVKPV